MLPDTMRSAAVRFRPPAVEFDPSVRWVLLRAFGPVDAPAPDAAPEEILRVARRLDLSARLVARCGMRRLAPELGPVAREFDLDRARAAAMGLTVAHLIERVVEISSEAGPGLALLKYAALDALGRLAPGGRSVSDLDILLSPPAGERLQAALIARGFRPSALSPPEQQLPALEGSPPDAGVIEIHRCVLGVRLTGGRSASLEDLKRANLFTSTSSWGVAVLVPRPEILVAHAIVHGLAQHGWSPRSYPWFRMMADLIDLGLADPAGAELAAAASAWIGQDVRRSEVEALRFLAAGLVAGRDLTEWACSAGPEVSLLRHGVAGRLVPEYEARLHLALFRSQPTDAGRLRRVLRLMLRTVWLSRPQVDAIYGPPRSSGGYWTRRLMRPFDLLARSARSLRGAVHLRSRRYTARQ
jgi:hypothetical protein